MTAKRVQLAAVDVGTVATIKKQKAGARCHDSWNVVCCEFRGRKVWQDDEGKIACYVGGECENNYKVYIGGRLCEIDAGRPVRNYDEYEKYLHYYYGI